MAEGDDDKEADVSKVPTKRSLDRVPLKIIIRRNRPNAQAKTPHSLVPTKVPPATVPTHALPTPVPSRALPAPVPTRILPVPVPPRVPPPRPLVFSEPPAKKPRSSSVLPLLLLSKYADIAELMTAFETEKPKGLQEVWHSVRQRQFEEDEERDGNGKCSTHGYYSTGVCDFGQDCEMPWLHPIINFSSWENNIRQETTRKEDEVAKKCLKTEGVCEASSDHSVKDLQNDESIHFSDWRYGAAKFWYDQMEIPDECKDFTYGFKLKEEPPDCDGKSKVFSDDAFLMVTQLPWEENVIWNGSDITPEVLNKMKSKWKSVGGRVYDKALGSRFGYQNRIPSYLNFPRGRDFFQKQLILKSPYSIQSSTFRDRDEEEAWKTVFQFENTDLITGIWENEIIWDPESMPRIPHPSIPTLNPNDENVVLGVPSDKNISQLELMKSPSCIKLPHPHLKGTKVVIKECGVCKVKEDDEQHFSLEDPFNVSNDSFYALKSSETSLRLKPVGKVIQHSIPVLELRPPFIPTHLNVTRLQNFHRIPLKKYSHGLMSRPLAHSVHSLTREINLKAMLRENEIKASGGGEVFFMREAEDLSGRDGVLVLVEFSEEHPLLMNEVGMCSKIINYYKRTASKDQGPPELKFGEVVYPHTSPFLGTLSPGQCIQAVENNLYRSPIYEHQIRETDFVVIRTRHSLSIREANGLFLAGQQCPLYEVPAPRSKLALNFTRDFLQVHIFRMFQNCPYKPQWVKMDEIKRAFPDISDLNIRKALKMCSDFKRVDSIDSSCWVLRPDFRLPSEEEIRDIISPEQCCAQFSMFAAEQRLKDAGYGGDVLFVPPDEEEEDDEEGLQLKIDDEVKAAPWNLTRGFIQAANGKSMLELCGLADPTGCGGGFSYLTRPLKRNKELVIDTTKTVREKPTVANARMFLKKMGVPDKEIKKLSPWELIDIARSASKRKTKGKGKSMKVPKIRPMTTAEHFAKYKDDCQRIFDLQNNVLQSSEELSTDEEEISDDDGSDVEEMGKILEKLISSGGSYSELRQENEEKEREELVKMMMDENPQKQSTSKDKPKKEQYKGPRPDRVLKINRTFRDSNGKEYTRVEFVRKSSVIDIYLKIRSTKDEAFIKQFAALERAEKQRMMREKRNIESQLLRLQQREHLLGSKNKQNNAIVEEGLQDKYLADGGNHKEINSKPFVIPSSKPCVSKFDPKRRCGACGIPGHKKGNKACPQYCGPVNVAMTEEEEEEYQRQLNIDDQNLVNVDGTKLKLSVKLIKRAEEMKKKTLLLRVPKDIVRKRKRPIVETHCDYLEKFQRTVNRRRVDPLVLLSNAFEAIINEMRDLPDSDPFHFPVNAKTLPHYYTKITRPMDLQTIRENLRHRKYHSRKDFLEDVHQIVQNSSEFNGPESPFTINAGIMLNLCARRMGDQEEELIKLEETINDEKEQASVPRGRRASRLTRKMPAKDSSSLKERQVVEETPVQDTVPKSIVDLAISDTEDEMEFEAGYLDGRACPVLP